MVLNYSKNHFLLSQKIMYHQIINQKIIKFLFEMNMGKSKDPTLNHISNHHHGSKIKYQSINILWTAPIHFAA